MQTLEYHITQLVGAGETLKETAKDAAEATEKEISFFGNLFGDILGPEKWSQYALSGLRILIVLLIFTLFYRVMRMLLHRVIGLQRRRVDHTVQQELDTLQHLLQSILFYVLLFVALVIILSILGFDMRGLIASAGVAGLVIAFVSQSIIKDWISGFFILIERQYAVGDWVTLGQYSGNVQAVGLRATVLIDDQNQTIYIPNGGITEIVNHSRLPRWEYLDIRVSYECDIDQAISVLESVCDTVNKAQEHTLLHNCHVLGVKDLDITSVVIRMRFASTLSNSYAIGRALRLAAKKALDEAQIDIPHSGKPDIEHYLIPPVKEGDPSANEASNR